MTLNNSAASFEGLSGIQFIRELGRGGMGAVFEVEKAGQRYALKLLTKPDPESRLRFHREAELLAQVDQHPHILRIHQTGELPQGPYILMELASSESLSARLRRQGPLEPGELLPLAKALAQALSVLHKKSIIHRDLKAANVLFSEDGRPLLADFGLARSSLDNQGLTRSGAVIGTPYSMAPEQIQGQSLSPAVDLWAFGILMAEALTAKPPFSGNSTQLATAIVSGAPAPLPESTPPALAALIEALLNKDPAQRPSLSQLIATLDQPRLLDPHSAWPRGRRVAAIIALTALGLTIALSLALRSTGSKPPSALILPAPPKNLEDCLRPLVLDRVLRELVPELPREPLDPFLEKAFSRLARLNAVLDKASPELRALTEQSIALNSDWRFVRALRAGLSEPPWGQDLAPLEVALASIRSNPENSESLDALERAIQTLIAAELLSSDVEPALGFIKAIRQKDFLAATRTISKGIDPTSLRPLLLEPALQGLAPKVMQQLEDQAFSSLARGDFEGAWRELRDFSAPQPENYKSWNRRIEALLNSDIPLDQAFTIFRNWQVLCSRDPAFSLPLARPDIHLAIARSPIKIGNFSPNLFNALQTFLADGKLSGHVQVAGAIDGQDAAIRAASLTQRSEVLDFFILTARRGFRFGSRSLYAALLADKLYELHIATARSELEEHLLRAQRAQALLHFGAIRRRSAEWLQVHQDFSKATLFLKSLDSLGQVEARTRDSHIAFLYFIFDQTPLEQREALWKSLGFDSSTQLFSWLKEQIHRCKDRGHDALDYACRNAFVFLHEVLLTSLDTPERQAARLWATDVLRESLLSLNQRRTWHELATHTENGRQRPLLPIFDAPDFLNSARPIYLCFLLFNTLLDQFDLARAAHKDWAETLDLSGSLPTNPWLDRIRAVTDLLNPELTRPEVETRCAQLDQLCQNYKLEPGADVELDHISLRLLARFTAKLREGPPR